MDGRGRHDSSVSVIIPAYNAENSLREAIDSALAQTHAPLEIIVVNDGSTDGTATVARSYGERIVCLEQTNRGQGAARNTGLRAARGDLIAFLDADDYWKPAFLQVCVEFLESHSDVIAVSTGLITRTFDGMEVAHPKPFCTEGQTPAVPFVLDDFFSFWATYDHVRTGSNVIRHAAIKRAGLQCDDLRIGQDLEYWGYLATFGKWGFIPRPLWVGNSRRAASRQGWLTRYRKRRKLCPDVEQWGRRIEPRLRPCEREAYTRVRGRVAMIYAQNKIIAGARESAYNMVREYGPTMPVCRMSKIMCSAVRWGRVGWLMACLAICCKEWCKAIRLWLGWRSRMGAGA